MVTTWFCDLFFVCSTLCVSCIYIYRTSMWKRQIESVHNLLSLNYYMDFGSISPALPPSLSLRFLVFEPFLLSWFLSLPFHYLTPTYKHSVLFCFLRFSCSFFARLIRLYIWAYCIVWGTIFVSILCCLNKSENATTTTATAVMHKQCAKKVSGTNQNWQFVPFSSWEFFRETNRVATKSTQINEKNEPVLKTLHLFDSMRMHCTMYIVRMYTWV